MCANKRTPQNRRMTSHFNRKCRGHSAAPSALPDISGAPLARFNLTAHVELFHRETRRGMLIYKVQFVSKENQREGYVSFQAGR